MEKNYSLIINKELHDDVVAYCKLNNVDDVEKFKSVCFVKGYNVEKYGLFGDEREINVIEHEKSVEVVKEVIKEVPVEWSEVERKSTMSVYDNVPKFFRNLFITRRKISNGFYD